METAPERLPGVGGSWVGRGQPSQKPRSLHNPVQSVELWGLLCPRNLTRGQPSQKPRSLHNPVQSGRYLLNCEDYYVPGIWLNIPQTGFIWNPFENIGNWEIESVPPGSPPLTALMPVPDAQTLLRDIQLAICERFTVHKFQEEIWQQEIQC